MLPHESNQKYFNRNPSHSERHTVRPLRTCTGPAAAQAQPRAAQRLAPPELRLKNLSTGKFHERGPCSPLLHASRRLAVAVRTGAAALQALLQWQPWLRTCWAK